MHQEIVGSILLPMSQHPRLVERLQELIDEGDYTVASLQRAAGISQTGIYDILDGSIRSPKLETVEKIATTLNVSVAYLIGESSDRHGAGLLVSNYAKMSKRDRDILLEMASRMVAETPADQASAPE